MIRATANGGPARTSAASAQPPCGKDKAAAACADHDDYAKNEEEFCHVQAYRFGFGLTRSRVKLPVFRRFSEILLLDRTKMPSAAINGKPPITNAEGPMLVAKRIEQPPNNTIARPLRTRENLAKGFAFKRTGQWG